MRVALHPDDFGAGDSSAPRWAEELRSSRVDVEWVDARKRDALDRILSCEGFMWRWGHANPRDRRIVMALIPILAPRVALYPDYSTCWHYDDKAAQALLFAALGVPAPRTQVFWDLAAAEEWAARADYPLVVKQASGAGGLSVALANDRFEAVSLSAAAFEGVLATASAPAGVRLRFGRARLRSIWRLALSGRLPRDVSGLLRPNGTPQHAVVLQEFCPGNSGDLRMTVIGNRLFAYRRSNRPGDFRASGSGLITHGEQVADEAMVRFGFDVASKLKMQSCAMDVVLHHGRPVVLEVSYTFVSHMVYGCLGHWQLKSNGDVVWVSGSMWPEVAQVQDFVAHLATRK